MNLSIESAVIFLLVIWVIALTFFVFKFYFYYSAITKGGKKSSIIEILDSVVKAENINKKKLDELRDEYVKLEKSGLSHIQKIGLVRFNPFKDTGGDQSFILALVDANNTGVIISSLHTRTGTRWYAKSVVGGKGHEYELSEEEEKALAGATLLSENLRK